MSFWASAMVAARRAVAAPMQAITQSVAGAISKRKLRRPIMYTPAVTIVAAWINAETGVGPAIASGSQTNKGICALLPVAPMKSRTAIEVMPPAKIVCQENGSADGMAAMVFKALATP